MNRWNIQIAYRSESEDGGQLRSFQVEELDELAQIVEDGPHWDAIEEIVVVRINETYPGLTIEGALKL